MTSSSTVHIRCTSRSRSTETIDPFRSHITVRRNVDEQALAAHVDTFMLLCNLALAHKAPDRRDRRLASEPRSVPERATDNDEIKHTSSVFDYISRWLGHTYGLPGFLVRNPLKPGSAVPADPFIEEMR